jgi:hypothetical protein
MKRRLIIGAGVVVAALACVGCNPENRPSDEAVCCAIPKPNEPPNRPQPEVGKDIYYPAIFAQNLNARKFVICGDAHAIVKSKLKALYQGATEATFPNCIDDKSQVQPLGDEHYAISSWVEFALARTKYIGEAVITEENGVARTLRITRLDIEGEK